MGNRSTFLTEEIVKYSLKIDAKGFAANHDANISVKLDDTLLATPTAVSKGNMTSEMIITLDADGKKIRGIGNPFSEIKLHLAAYRARPEANAVVHAHPPTATARGLIGKAIEPKLPEAIVSLGNLIPVAPLTMPGSPESLQTIEEIFQTADVCMIAGNGVLAIGDSIEQAFLRLELVEHLAKIELYASQMGEPLSLPNEMVQVLLEKRAAAGLGPKQPSVEKNQTLDSLSFLIAEEIKKTLLNHETA